MSLSVCVCVCVSVCLSVSEQNYSRTDALIWTRFSFNGGTGSDPIKIGDLWLKVKVTVTQYPFFLHNSLLTSQLTGPT